MPLQKADIISQLQKDILLLQGYKPLSNAHAPDPGLGVIKHAFPNSRFPLGAVHEFCCAKAEDTAATGGFISAIIAKLMFSGAACIWISASRNLFPPAFEHFGIPPEKIIFIDLQKEKDILWAMEEALKCNGLAAVVGEMRDLGFTASRRLQLAVEQSRVTGFVLRLGTRKMNTTACVTRWKITPLHTVMVDDLPGLGFPQWNVELLKVRNGKPGNWQMMWANGRLQQVHQAAGVIRELKRQTG